MNHGYFGHYSNQLEIDLELVLQYIQTHVQVYPCAQNSCRTLGHDMNFYFVVPCTRGILRLFVWT